jgi:hypothetical protein
VSDKIKPIRVKIHDYQSIESLDFEIRGFTAISGRSNIGKSAIIRAISSSILNNPVVGMVRKGASFASVELSCEDWGFKWEKGEKGINRYTINDKVLDKVGAKQLEEIAKLGFKSVKVGTDEINPWLASQFFPIFLLDKPGSQVTDFISEVSRLNVLQDAIILSARGKRKSNDESTVRDTESRQIQAHLAKFNNVDELQLIHDDLEDQFKSIEEYSHNIQYLESKAAVIEDLERRISKASGFEKISMPEELDSTILDKFVSGKHSLDIINRIALGIIAIKKVSTVNVPDEIDIIERYEQMSKYAWIPAAVSDVDSMEQSINADVPEDVNIQEYMGALQAFQRVQSIQSKIPSEGTIEIPEELEEARVYSELCAIQSRLEAEAANCVKLRKQIKDSESEITEIEKEISKIPLCPTCSRPHMDGAH